jgi:DNA-directed RNA polymerase specialized sigma24 family protein
MARPYENDLEGVKLSDIATELGCSKSRAKQIEKRALQKLRKALEARGIDAETVIRYLADRDAYSPSDWSEDV